MHCSGLHHNDERVRFRAGSHITTITTAKKSIAPPTEISVYLLIHEKNFLQVDSLKRVLERFYGKDPLQSYDLSRIVNSNHFRRLTKLIEDKKVADKIVLGGQIDVKQL